MKYPPKNKKPTNQWTFLEIKLTLVRPNPAAERFKGCKIKAQARYKFHIEHAHRILSVSLFDRLTHESEVVNKKA